MKLKKFIKALLIGSLALGLVPNVDAALERKVKVSSNDQTSGFLNGKLVAGSNVSIVENNDGANESLTLNASTSGTGVILDLADDASNESTALSEIASTGDTNGIMSEPSADKLLFDFSNAVPLSDALSADGTNASAGNAILGVDASGNAQGAFDVLEPSELNSEAELEALLVGVSNVFTDNDTVPVANGGTNLTAATDDNVMVGNGTTWQSKSVPDCDGTTDKLAYTASTNSYSCITDQNASGTGYSTIEDEGTPLTQRSIVDFTGSGVTCTDNGGSGQTECVFSSGGQVPVDLGNNASDEISALSRINTANDTNSVVTNNTGDEILFDMGQNWPTADTANAGDSATAFFSAGTVEHERGGLEADVSAFSGLLSVSAGSTAQINTKAGVEGLLSDVADIAEADGDIYTGTHDFGGATATEIENNATLSLANDGEVGIDTTDDQLHYYSSASTRVLTYKKDKGFVLSSPADTDRIVLYSPFDAITITDIDCIVDPADSGESVVIALYESDGAGDFTDLATNGVDGTTTITCDNDGALDDGSLSNPTIDAGDYLGVDVGTVTGTVDNLTVTFVYTVDAE